MQTVYIGNTLVNDAFLGNQKIDDIIAKRQPMLIDWLLVGGGGGGGTAAGPSSYAGGGGAGRFVSSSIILQPTFSTRTIVVGSGGTSVYNTNGTNGNDSTFTSAGITYIAPGGGGGGKSGTNGLTGGSGGGAGRGNNSGGGVTVGSPIAGFGYGGGSSTTGGPAYGEGGGGAGGAGIYFGNGGLGLQWIDGIYYAYGGCGAAAGCSSPTCYGRGGDGGTDTPTSNAGGGVFKFRYKGAPLFDLGTITQIDGYTYHTCTAGTYTFNW